MEAYPVQGGGYMGMAFTGPMRLYEKAGFEETAHSGDVSIMRKKLA